MQRSPQHLHQNIGAVDVLVQHRVDAAHLALDAAQPVGKGAVLLRGTVLVAAAGGGSVLFGRLSDAAGLFSASVIADDSFPGVSV